MGAMACPLAYGRHYLVSMQIPGSGLGIVKPLSLISGFPSLPEDIVEHIIIGIGFDS